MWVRLTGTGHVIDLTIDKLVTDIGCLLTRQILSGG